MRIACLFVAVMFYFCVLDVYAQDLNFPKAAKIIPRMGRSKPPVDPRNDAFEKFFLKASKSVPRIGRREPPMVNFLTYFFCNMDIYVATKKINSQSSLY